MTSMQKWVASTVAIVVTVIGGVLILAINMSGSEEHHFSAAEQEFLVQAKRAESQSVPFNSNPAPWGPWPSDAELVREAHQVCSIEDSGGGIDQADRSLWGRGYSSEQITALVILAENNLCPSHSLRLRY